MKAKFWNSEKLLSISAILISVCTLFVFVYQTNLIREQQYNSVFPYLEMGNFGTNTENYGFYLTNKGIGPAMIKSVEIQYKDSIYEEDLAGYLSRRITKKDSIYYTHSNIGPGRLISADDEIILAAPSINDIKMGNSLYQIINDKDLNMIIEYESIYGERWRLSFREVPPVKIE
jgi:hypothetical protein